MDRYTLEFLSEEFGRHIKGAEKFQKDLVKSFKKNNPGEKIPEGVANDFSLSKALKAIVDELIEVKNGK